MSLNGLIAQEKGGFRVDSPASEVLDDHSLTKVEERQNKIRLTGDASKDFHEKSCCMTQIVIY